MVRPIGTALLAAAVAARGERGLSTRLEAEDPNGHAWAYLQRIAFFAELRYRAAARVQAEALASCIERDLPELPPRLDSCRPRDSA